MSLIRQMWLMMLGVVLLVVLLALFGGVSVTVASARDALQTQLRAKNTDNAQSLALVLSQQRGDKQMMELMISAQFDTGAYRRIRLARTDGNPDYVREMVRPPQIAPKWFSESLPIVLPPGTAQVSNGWQNVGTLEVESQVSYVYDELWQSSLRTALWLAIIATIACALTAFGVRWLLRPLEATAEQAQALVEGRFMRVPEPRITELKRVTRAMNVLVQRVRSLYDAHAKQIEALRRQAHGDSLTGLSQRPHFMERLSALLQREDGVDGGSLLLVRLAGLPMLNRLFGRTAVDRALLTIAHTVQAYPERLPESFTGRLNGADFALVLPAPGMAEETAQAIAVALQATLPSYGTAMYVHIGAVEMPRGAQAGAMLAQADLALARAESRGPFAVEVLGERNAKDSPALGEHAWHERIVSALSERRTRLVEFPVLDRQGALVHFECPLRLQLEPDGAFEPAMRWLPLALRSRQTAGTDRHAVMLALEAIAQDGHSRSVNIALASLMDSGFIGHVRQLVHDAPRQARKLWIEVGELAAVERFELVQELGRLLRPLGVRYGLEHAGQRLHRIERLYELGLDFVKLDASLCTGVSHHLAGREFIKGTVTLLHALSVQVHAEGVGDGADAKALWECGIDAITGPAVRTPPAG